MTTKGTGPLNQAIQKRKTQEIMRAIEEKKIAQARGTGPLPPLPKRTGPLPPAPTTVSPDAKRSSQIMRAIPPAADEKPTTQTYAQFMQAELDARRKTQTTTQPYRTSIKRQTAQVKPPSPVMATGQARKIGVIAGIVALLMVLTTGTMLLVAGNAKSEAPHWSALPNFSAENMMAHLLSVGVSVSNVQRANIVELTKWKANQGFDFKIDRNADHGQFILLSYPSDDGANQAAFRAKLTSEYKQWQSTKASNVLLLASPDTSKTIFSEMSSHLRQFIVAPYRNFLATATPELP